MYDKQESIPVGCVPLTSVATQCATFVGNSYQTFGLATDKTYQTELNLTGPNKNNDFLYNKC